MHPQKNTMPMQSVRSTPLVRAKDAHFSDAPEMSQLAAEFEAPELLVL